VFEKLGRNSINSPSPEIAPCKDMFSTGCLLFFQAFPFDNMYHSSLEQGDNSSRLATNFSDLRPVLPSIGSASHK
jgi:hypothetical protein